MQGDQKKKAANALAFLRIVLGGWFLWAGIPKLNAQFFNEGLAGALGYFNESGALAFYKGMLVFAQSHSKGFAVLVAVGEVLTGASLVLGLLTPIAGVAVILMCANYLFATWNLGPASIGVNLICVALGVSFVMGHAGCHFGLDQKICKHDA